MALARMLGYDTSGQLQEAVRDIATEVYTNPSQHGEALTLLARKGSLSQVELTARRKDDSVMWEQSYAGGSVVEPVQVSDLLAVSLRMNAAASVQPLDMPRLLQILVNLIGNARQAIGGTLTAHSEGLGMGMGMGATFTLTLPVQPDMKKT